VHREQAGPTVRAVVAAVVSAVVALTLLAACSSSNGTSKESVFSVAAGQCFRTPSTVKAELSDLTKVQCTKPHTEEAYAVIDYKPSTAAIESGAPTSTSAYPGADVLTSFAKGACAQQFSSYVGIDYLDSSLFFTYLLPSARGWEQEDDRSVLCFVTTTGRTLTKSVKGAKI
jgi:hypothetical protein